MKCVIIIFTRVPEPGQTKTRMILASSAKGCARLHTCFPEDIERECGKMEGQLFACSTPDEGREFLYPVFGRGRCYISQRGNGLGEWMCQTIREILGRGYNACILMGVDVSEARVECLERTLGLLEQKDVVLGSARDGGYYLVDMRRPWRAVFEVEGYGQGSVLQDTIHRVKTEECTVGFTEVIWDVSIYQSLRGCHWRMREDKRLQSTSTGRYLAKTSRISIIIPIYSGEKTIYQIQDQLESLRGTYEAPLVGGGSTDKTMGQIRP